MIGEVIKPTWSRLVDKLRAIKPSAYEVFDVSDPQGLQKAKDAISRMYQRSKRVSVIVITE